MIFDLRAVTALGTTILFLVPGAPLAQSSFDWTGGYLGLTLGGAGSRTPLEFVYEPAADGPDSVPLHASGAMAGVTAGYNWQAADGLVLGIEGDASFSTVQGASESGRDSFEASLESLLSLRARLGVQAGNALFYATAGVAGGRVEHTASVVEIGLFDEPAEASGFAAGVIGGAGVELALTDNLSVKAEGLVYRLGAIEGVGDTGKGEFTSSYAPSGVTLRAGLNFQL